MSKEQTAIQKEGDELVQKFWIYAAANRDGSYKNAIQCAIICCQSHIDDKEDAQDVFINDHDLYLVAESIRYWQSIKDYLQTKL